MPAVALPSERHWDLKGDELANPFVLELLEELRIVQGLVLRENEQRTARRKQQKRFHRTLLQGWTEFTPHIQSGWTVSPTRPV